MGNKHRFINTKQNKKTSWWQPFLTPRFGHKSINFFCCKYPTPQYKGFVFSYFAKDKHLSCFVSLWCTQIYTSIICSRTHLKHSVNPPIQTPAAPPEYLLLWATSKSHKPLLYGVGQSHSFNSLGQSGWNTHTPAGIIHCVPASSGRKWPLMSHLMCAYSGEKCNWGTQRQQVALSARGPGRVPRHED